MEFVSIAGLRAAITDKRMFEQKWSRISFLHTILYFVARRIVHVYPWEWEPGCRECLMILVGHGNVTVILKGARGSYDVPKNIRTLWICAKSHHSCHFSLACGLSRKSDASSQSITERKRKYTPAYAFRAPKHRTVQAYTQSPFLPLSMLDPD